MDNPTRRRPRPGAKVLAWEVALAVAISAITAAGAPAGAHAVHRRWVVPQVHRSPSLRPGAVRCGLLDKRRALTVRGGQSVASWGEDEDDDDEEEEKEDDETDEYEPHGRAAARHRAGAAREEDEEDELEEGEEESPELDYDLGAAEWMMEQICLHETKIALISNKLAAKGYKVREIVPSPRGLVCALSTEEHQMPCRMFMTPEDGKKVVAPCKCKGTQKWIGLTALNSERRKEPDKWKKCPTCQAPIDYKLYEEHGGGVGKAISAVLNRQKSTRIALWVAVFNAALILYAPAKWLLIRFLVSGLLWRYYHLVSFFVYLPLPFKILGARYLMKEFGKKFDELERQMRQVLTDAESTILEQRVPVTVDAAKALAAEGEEA